MRRRGRNRVWVMWAAVLAALVLGGTAVPAGAEGAQAERPWREVTDGEAAISDCTTANGITTCAIQLDYTTHATHVGQAQISGSGQIVFRPAVDCVGPTGLDGFSGTTTSDEVITAADGSEVHTHVVYDLCVGAGWTATRTVLGGTGRFAGASGSMNLVTFTDGPTDVTGTGTISY